MGQRCELGGDRHLNFVINPTHFNNYSSTAVTTILTSLILNIGLKSFLSTAVSVITAVCCCYSPAESPNFMGMEVCAFKIVTD